MDRQLPERVLGIDPGLNVTGYAVLEVAVGGPKLCEAGVVRSNAKEALSLRVTEIHAGIREVIEAFQPVAVALEELYSHYNRPKTAILMGHARGVICLAAGQSNIPVHGYNATRIKKTLTGNGHASKGQMQLAVGRELGLAKLPEPHDVADALAAALCFYYQQPRWAALARRRA